MVEDLGARCPAEVIWHGTRNVLDEEQLAEMVLAPEGWQVEKSTIPTGYMMHIMSVGNGVKATLCGREGLHIVNSLHRDVSKCKRLCDTGLCGDLHERNSRDRKPRKLLTFVSLAFHTGEVDYV